MSGGEAAARGAGADERRSAGSGARHDQIAALREVIARSLPGSEPSDAMLLGLGGGLGFALFTFRYEGQLPHLYVETRCTPQFAYDEAFVARAIAGVGLRMRVRVAGSASKARAELDAALAAGRPVIAFVDAEVLPWRGRGHGAVPWTVAVVGAAGDEVRVVDVEAERRMSRADFERARAGHAKGKHRLVEVEGEAVRVTAEGVRAGLAHCVAALGGAGGKAGFARNFGLGALEKWEEALNGRGRGSWRKVFPAGAPLFAGLRQTYRWIECAGTGGGAFRRAYAEFLREAGGVVGEARFAEVAARYDELASGWSELSRFPAGVAVLDAARELESRRARVPGDARAGGDELAAIDLELAALATRASDEPALAADAAEAIYAGLADRVGRLLEGERAALAELATLA